MKRAISLALVLCMLASMLCMSVFASGEEKHYEDKYGEWVYVENEDSTLTIVRYVGERKNIVVPRQIDGLPVRVIGARAFAGNVHLCNVILPGGLTAIKEGAFSGCTHLEALTIPGSVKEIGDGAFQNCESLSTLHIPDSVEEPGEGLFEGCPAHVTCNAGSVAAEYLVAHKDELNSLTIYRYEPAASPASAPVAEPEPDGSEMIYRFGKTINGRAEYTLVLLDTDPDWKLANHMRFDSETGLIRLDEESQDRFVFRRLTRYDGVEEKDLSDMYPVRSLGPGNPLCVLYTLYSEGTDGIINEFRVSIDENRAITDYGIKRVKVEWSTLLPGMELISTVSLRQEYQTDGTQFANQLSASKSVYEGESSVGSQTKTVCLDANNKVIAEYKDLNDSYDTGRVDAGESRSYNAEGVCETVTSHMQEWSESEKVYSVAYATVTRGQVGESSYISENIDYENGVEVSKRIRHDSRWETELSIYYVDETVTGETEEDARKAVNGVHFANEADEHTQFVSTRYVQYNTHKSEWTDTDLEAGEVSEGVSLAKTEKLSDHRYVADTGMYNGWDWEWNYDLEDLGETGCVTNYMVTEYRYDSGSGEWTKTVATVQLKKSYDEENDTWVYDAAAKNYDFKETFPEELLENYDLLSKRYVYDESDTSGSDNWRWDSDCLIRTDTQSDELHYSYTDEDGFVGVDDGVVSAWDEVNEEYMNVPADAALKEKLEDIQSEAVSIVTGKSEIPDEDGAVLKQSEVKAEMFELVENLAPEDLDEAVTPYDVAVEHAENGSAIYAAIEIEQFPTLEDVAA